ncbi:hypothetical protein ACJMK2_019648 [Sinanodonta woodiana]|uniref:HTH CENPB-type domain-containing protein n=1 Tax=Sinanodonta woodiana TaxID=1069815 RepID=A0ABD3TWG1_SINWO
MDGDVQQFSVDGHADSLVQALYELWQKDILCDTAISIKGHMQTKVHSVILQVACGSKETWTLPQLKPFTPRDAFECIYYIDLLEEIQPSALIAFVKFLYTGELLISYSLLMSLIKLATFFDNSTLLEICLLYQSMLPVESVDANSIPRKVSNEKVRSSLSEDIKRTSPGSGNPFATEMHNPTDLAPYEEQNADIPLSEDGFDGSEKSDLSWNPEDDYYQPLSTTKMTQFSGTATTKETSRISELPEHGSTIMRFIEHMSTDDTTVTLKRKNSTYSETHTQPRLETAINVTKNKILRTRKAKHSGPYGTLSGTVLAGEMHSSMFSLEDERRLVEWCIHSTKIGYSIPVSIMQESIKEVLDAAGRETKFKNNIPGHDWCWKFYKRHDKEIGRKDLALPQEGKMSKSERVDIWSSKFIEFLKSIEVEEQAELLSDPSRRFTITQRGFAINPESGDVIKVKDPKNLFLNPSTRETQITVVGCVSGTGHCLPPLIVYPGVLFLYDPLLGFQEAKMGSTEDGWLDSNIFYTWLHDTFIPKIKKDKVKLPLLLFVDGCNTPIPLKIYELCKGEGIILYCIKIFSILIQQPLDLCLFSPLKSTWSKVVRKFGEQNQGEKVTKVNFAQVFKKFWDLQMSKSNIIEAFKESGLYPDKKAKHLLSSEAESAIHSVLSHKPQ